MKAPIKPLQFSQKKIDPDLLNKRKAEAAGSTDKKKKKSAAAKDPDRPKRPPSGYLLFMEVFRKSYKEEFPENKSMSDVAKAGGEKWKSMSESEKAVYNEGALKKKAEYEVAVAEYKKKKNLNENEDIGESDASTSGKSKSGGSGESKSVGSGKTNSDDTVSDTRGAVEDEGSS